jgi:hypothetical protein
VGVVSHSTAPPLAQFARGLVGVCGRLFRRDAPASQSFAHPEQLEQAMRIATTQLNARAKPWVWGRYLRLYTLGGGSFVIAFKEQSTNFRGIS